MTVTVHVTAVEADLELVAAALDEAATTRRRAAVKASAELVDEALGDQAALGAGAILVVGVLAQADTLTKWAAALRTATARTPTGVELAAAAERDQRIADATYLTGSSRDDLERIAAAAADPVTVPALTDLIADYNAALAGRPNGAQPPAGPPTMVNDAPVWTAPDVYADDDEPTADELGADVTLDMR